MKYKSSQLGFSLVEVLVAITILLLFVARPMQIITNANHSTGYASQQVNAFFLAQEGLELAEKGRDDLLLQYFRKEIHGIGSAVDPMSSFKTNFNDCFSGSGCDLLIGNGASANISVKSCSLPGCKLYLDSSSNRASYTHNTTTDPSPYSRLIKMERIPSSGKIREIKITSTVTWRTGAFIADQTVSLVTYLENTHDTN